ncbi:uncharacterized protein [Aegilops tauschii subsp. strangulata]|uniref:uncharacterized protein n=1 Tax=Aegilops tauschii subsp. strangulata TaxID=200361 RepID=UPI003CC8D868
MSWNVRGINALAKRSAICEVATTLKTAILTLQETKVEVWTTGIAKEIGGPMLQGCAVLPAMGTRGGAAIFWNKEIVEVESHSIGRFTITAKVKELGTNIQFWLTTVYGPNDDGIREDFLQEMSSCAPPLGQAWLITGDFNMIYEARDKNNQHLNRRLMGRFRRALDFAGLREIKCKNRRFTWSNERENPSLCSIDKFFCNPDWEILHDGYMLHAESTSFSDHCPLIMSRADCQPRKARFRFENFWPQHPHYSETVQHAWERPVNHDCPFVRIKIKMQRVAKDLKIWSRSLFSKTKLQFHIANEVILQLDIAQEKRALTAEEFNLRKLLKTKVLGLAAIERARKRQASRVKWLRAGTLAQKNFMLNAMQEEEPHSHA